MHIGLISRSQVDYAIDLASGFSSEGHPVTLYMDYIHATAELGDDKQPVENIYRTGLLPKTCKIRLLQTPRMRDLRSFSLFRGLVRAIREDEVDVVHILLNPGEIWFALLALLLKDIPVVTTMIVPVANTGERLPAPVVWGTNKLAVCGSDMVIVNGTSQVELVSRIYKIPADQIAYVPLSFRVEATQWRDRTILEEPATVLFFGRADQHKGLEYLVKAQPLITREIPDARILISAHGDDLDRCVQMIGDHSKFEIIDGFVPGNVMATFFQRATLVVLPYISASTSGVLVTAYSFAKPVVASRVGCMTEYVEDGVTGLLVTPKDVKGLADAIVRLLSDKDLCRRMGTSAEEWMIKLEKSSVKQTIDVYEKATSIHLKKIHSRHSE